ncbi:MAG TPA: Hpt domain-containing protein, partial [Gammaproteobacteria bacterium]|nr:Hpt domain-containing protein [Gammaproteobacteria bacterium]
IDIKKLALTLDRWLIKDNSNNALDNASAEINTDRKPKIPENVDMGRLHEIFGDDNETIYTFLRNFTTATNDLLKELNRAIQEKNTSTAKELFHRLKGSAGNSGVTAIFELCKKSEQDVLNNDWGGAKKAYREIETLLRQLEDEIR